MSIPTTTQNQIQFFRSPAEKNPKVNFNFYFPIRINNKKYVLYSFFNLPFKLLEHSLLITKASFLKKKYSP